MSIEDWLHLGHEARYLSASIQDFGDFRDLRKRLPAARPMCKKKRCPGSVSDPSSYRKKSLLRKFLGLFTRNNYSKL